MPQTLAIFDLDNTLLGGDSDHAWGEFLSQQGLVDPVSHRKRNDAFYDDYCRGELDILAYQRFALSTIAGQRAIDLEPTRQQFVETMVKPMMLEQAAALLDQHRSKNHLLMIITATNDFVTRPIADLLGIEHLLACEAEIVDGIYTGDITGIPCFQEGKVKRLQSWLLEKPYNLEGSYFYSDSHNDIPLLEMVTHPVAVDADEKLAAHAHAKGWDAISLRNS